MTHEKEHRKRAPKVHWARAREGACQRAIAFAAAVDRERWRVGAGKRTQRERVGI